MSSARRTTWAQVRATVWFFPSLAVVAAFLLTLVLLVVRPDPASTFAEWAWPGDASASTALLQVVGTVSVTAASLTFSLTVVALQLASQQFSPRLLRGFARDRVIQLTMGLLLSAFVVSLTTLRGLDPERPLPVLALLLSLLLGLLAAGTLLAFIAHLVRSLRVNTMMASVHADTRASIHGSYPEHDEDAESPPDDLPAPGGGVLLPARRSGFVRAIEPAPLIDLARQHGVFLRLGLRPGDAVVAGTPVGSAWALDGGEVDADALADRLGDAVVLGPERTEEQDVGFGFRQLVDIAIKAISPGVNDPTTCAEALGHCGDLLVLLQQRRLGAQLKRDADGRPRLELPDRDHRYYLDQVCAQPRRFGRGQPEVLTALLRVLRDCAVTAREEQRPDIAAQADLVLLDMDASLNESDADAVRDLHRRVCLALDGDVAAAYEDRAGETRSI